MPPKRFCGPMPSWWDNFLRRRQIRACRGEAEFGLARLASSTTSGGYGPKPIAKWPFVTPFLRGTESSDPPPSSGESRANLVPLHRRNASAARLSLIYLGGRSTR
jgi:hypothetical protein